MATSTLAPLLSVPTSSNGWLYTVIGGLFIGVYSASLEDLEVTTSSTGVYCSAIQQVSLPVTIDTSANASLAGTSGSGTWIANTSVNSGNVQFRLYRNASVTATIGIQLICCGKVS